MNPNLKARTLSGWTIWYALAIALFVSSVAFDMPGWLFWTLYGVFTLGGLVLLVPPRQDWRYVASWRRTDSRTTEGDQRGRDAAKDA